MQIKTESIKNYLDLIFGNYTQDDLSKVDSLTIKKYNAISEPIAVEYKDLLSFPNLETLTLDSCMLDSNLMNILEITNIKKLFLINCENLENIEQNLFALNLDTLLIDNTALNLNILPSLDIPNLTLANIDLPLIPINSKKLDIARINNLSNLDNINTKELIINKDHYDKLNPLNNDIKYTIVDLCGDLEEGD